jgi:leucyl-tRNA synthetase
MVSMNEKELLLSAKSYLKDTLGCEVEIYSADDKNLYDPAQKTKFAVPGRPAIYIE